MNNVRSVDGGWQFAGLPGPLVRLQVSVLCVTIGMGMVYSVLALDAKSLGASAFLAGILLAAFGGTRFLANVPTGFASERFGRRLVAICGLLIAAVASILAATTHDYSSLLVCVLFQGLAMGIYNTSSLSAIADLGTTESRVRDMAAYQGAFVFGLSLGPALGGAAAARWGYGAPFILQGLLALCAVAVLYRSVDVQQRQGAKFEQRLLATLAGPAAVTYSVIFTRGVTVWVLLPLIAHQTFSMTVGNIGLMLTVGSIATLAVLPIAAPLARRVGRSAIMLGSASIIVAALALLTFDSNEAALWVSSFLLGAGSGLALPISVACAADLAPKGQTGAAMGLMRSMTDIGMLTGPIVVGLAIDHLPYGERGGIAICVVLLIVSTASFLLIALGRRTAIERTPVNG